MVVAVRYHITAVAIVSGAHAYLHVYTVHTNDTQIPIVVTFNIDPFPNTLEANTETVMSSEEIQEDEEILNTWLHSPPLQEEVLTVPEPQLRPDLESEYTMV